MAYTYNNIIKFNLVINSIINYNSMNYNYVAIYVGICIIVFILIFMRDEAVGFLFERKYNNITDYNDPKYTGGIEYIFNPLGLLTGV